MLRAFGLAVILAAGGLGGVAGADPTLRAGDAHRFVWNVALPGFGGLSGLELSSDGADFLALSDRGALLRGSFTRDATGAVTHATLSSLEILKDLRGAPLSGEYLDAEALALDGAGGFFVAFEFHHRIWHYAAPGATPTALPQADWMRAQPLNKGVEALAYDPAHGLIAMAEEPIAGAFALHQWQGEYQGQGEHQRQGGAWRVIGTLHQHGGFQITGADFGPDGALYLIERRLGLLGFRSQLRRLSLAQGGVVETLMQSDMGTFDNLEAIALWQDPGGDTWLTTVSDDNFVPFQRTEIIEFRLTD